MGVLAPEVSVSAGGNDIACEGQFKIHCICVTLQMNEASSAVVAVEDTYDTKSRRLNKRISDHVKPGSPVMIQMGYAGSKADVFSGYLERIELAANADSGYMLYLYICDILHLMKENVFSRIITQKSHSAVLDELMSSYTWLGTMVISDATAEYDEARCWYQNGSDYEFLMRELLAHCPDDREIYASLGTVYYQKPDNSKTIMTLNADEGIYSCRAVSRFLKRKVSVYGSSSSYQSFSGEAKIAADFLDAGAEAGGEHLLIAGGYSQDFVENIAKSHAAKLKRKSQELEIELPGDNRLLIGCYIKVDKLDDIWNGVYRIVLAEHTYNENGYHTKIRLEGS